MSDAASVTGTVAKVADEFGAPRLLVNNGGAACCGLADGFVDEIPLGRPMAPEEIAELCAFLAGNGAAAISGQAINVSGAHEVH